MKKVLLAVAIVALVCGRASAALVLEDNFDSYANQAAFEAAWPVVTGTGGTLSTAQSSSPPNSINYPTTAQRNGRTISETGTAAPLTLIKFSFDFYDSNAAASPYRQYANIQDGAVSLSGQLISMGLNNNLTSGAQGGNFYMARILGGSSNGGAASAYFKLNDNPALVRTTGWHNLAVVISTTAFTFFVDGVLAETVPSTLTLRSYDHLRLGSGLSSTQAAFFDNVRVETIAIPEASSMAAIGLVGLLSAGAVWLRKRRAGRAAA